MPTSNEKFQHPLGKREPTAAPAEPTIAERHEHEGRTPQPGVPIGPRDTQYPAAGPNEYEYSPEEYAETGLTPPPERTKQEAKEIKRKKRHRRAAGRITSIEDSLDFSRSKRAKSYEDDALTKLSHEYFQHEPDGSLKTHPVRIPVLKTNEHAVKAEEKHLNKIIHHYKVNGASPHVLKALHEGAAAQVIKNNYALDKHGNVAADQKQVPAIKPGKASEFEKELARVQKHTHEIKEGTKSYFFQSRISKHNEHALLAKMEAEHPKGGILKGIPVVGGALNDIAEDPAGALYRVIAPVPTLVAQDVFHVNFTRADEGAITNASRGVGALNKLFAGSTALQDANMKASGIPVLEGLPSLRKSVIHGLHTGVQTGTEYLTRPGLVIEQGIGQGVGAGGNVWNAILHGHNGKGVISGKDISEQLTGNPTGGLLIDFATDPTLWVGAGEIKLAEGEQLSALVERMSKANDGNFGVLEGHYSNADLVRAMETGDAHDALAHLKQIAVDNGVSVRNLGKTTEDKAAIKDWQDVLRAKKEQEVTSTNKGREQASPADIKAAEGKVNVARDRLTQAEKAGDKESIKIRTEQLSDAHVEAARLQSQGKFGLGGKERQTAADEVVRHGNESKTVPGVRINIQTPLGRHLKSIDVKLPDSVANKANILPDLHVSPTMRKENYKELLALRESKIDAQVLKAYDPEIRDAQRAIKDAKTPEEAAKARTTLDEIKGRLDYARQQAKDSIETTKLRTPAEEAAQRSSRRLAHNLNRLAASSGSSSVFHRMFANMDDAMKGLSKEQREKVGLHMAEFSDTGGRDIAHSIAPLDDKEALALEKLKTVNYELGKFGIESGTIENLMKDYAYRHVVSGPNPLSKGREVTAAERASTMKAAGDPSKARGYAATAEVTGRDHLATQLEKLSGGKLTHDEALALADEWHERGKVRTLQEDLVHSIQRGSNPTERNLTDIEKEAISWGQGRQKEDGKPVANLFKKLEDTEGTLKLDSGAHTVHEFAEDPFGHMTAKEANALKHATAQGSLERLRKLRDATERPEVRDQLDSIIARREAEVNSFRQVANPERKSYTKINKRIKKVEALRDRPGTPGEGAAAQALLDRLKKTRDERVNPTPTEFKDFIPQQASKEYLGSLKDFRKNHPDQFTILDPKLANYHRSLRESIKSAYTMRWRAADRAYGLDANDAKLRSPDERLFYDKKTGKEYIYADPTVFKGAIKEGRVLPAQLHAELKAEFFRMGENVAHDLFDDANAGLFAKISGMARFSLTTYFPAYHMRNMISDSMNSLLADPGVLFHPVINTKLAYGAAKGDRAAVSPLIDVPGFTGKMKTADYLFMMETLGLKSQEHLADFVMAAEKGELTDHPLWRKINPGKKGAAGEAALRMSARREDIIRMQTFLQRMRRNGGDAAEAAWHTIKYHFDYADLSQWEKRYMRNAFLFYTWYRKNIPLQFLSMIQKPGFFSALTNSYIELAEGGTPFNQNWNKINPLLPDMSGPVPNSGLIPDYMTRIMAAPVVNWNGHATALSMGLPWADMNLITNFGENPEEGIRGLVNMLTPIPRGAAELGFKTSLLTGQELKGYENSTWSNLLSMGGIKLAEDDEGRPILPWQVAVVLNNLFPAVGRGAGYLKPPSSVEDQGRFNSLFGGGAGTFLSGVSITMTPKEGERLDKAYIYKVYERATAREAVIESGKKDSEKEADLKKFDEQTAEWAVANGIPKKYLKVVQGLGSKWFVSKSDKKVKAEADILGNEEGGITGTGGGSILGGEGGAELGHESFTPPSKKYKSRTEEALNLLGNNTKEGGFVPAIKGTPTPSKFGVEGALAYLHDVEHEERDNAPVAADALHRGKEPEREAKVPAAPRAEGRTAPTQAKPPAAVKPTEQATIKLLEANGATANVARAAAKRMGPEGWAEAQAAEEAGFGNKPTAKNKAIKKERHKAVAQYHAAKSKVESEGLPTYSGFSHQDQEEFAKYLTKYSGLDPKFIGAWVAQEGGGYSNGGEAGENNWLGVGYPGHTTEMSEAPVWKEGPKKAAEYTAKWLRGEVGQEYNWGPSSSSIQELSHTVGQDAETQRHSLESSDWGTGEIGTWDAIDVTGATGVDPSNKKKLAAAEAHLKKLGIKPDSLSSGAAQEAHKIGGAWDGTEKILHKITHGIEISSTKRTPAHNAEVGGAEGSDHLTTMTNAFATDLPASGGAGTAIMEKVGKRLGVTPQAGSYEWYTSPKYPGYRFQILWEVEGHYDHVHVGAEWTGEAPPPGTSPGGYVWAGESAGSGPAPASGAATSAPGASAPATGAKGQENKGFHPGRSAEATAAAKEMRGNIKGAFGLASGSSGSSDFNPKEIKTPKIVSKQAKLRAEIDQIMHAGTAGALTSRTKRKPRFKV